MRDFGSEKRTIYFAKSTSECWKLLQVAGHLVWLSDFWCIYVCAQICVSDCIKYLFRPMFFFCLIYNLSGPFLHCFYSFFYHVFLLIYFFLFLYSLICRKFILGLPFSEVLLLMLLQPSFTKHWRRWHCCFINAGI